MSHLTGHVQKMKGDGNTEVLRNVLPSHWPGAEDR